MRTQDGTSCSCEKQSKYLVRCELLQYDTIYIYWFIEFRHNLQGSHRFLTENTSDLESIFIAAGLEDAFTGDRRGQFDDKRTSTHESLGSPS